MVARELEPDHAYEPVVEEFSQAFEAVYGKHVEAGLTESLKVVDSIWLDSIWLDSSWLDSVQLLLI